MNAMVSSNLSLVEQKFDTPIWSEKTTTKIATTWRKVGTKPASGRIKTTGAYMKKKGNRYFANAAFIASQHVPQQSAFAICDATSAPMAMGGVMCEEMAETKQKRWAASNGTPMLSRVGTAPMATRM